MVVVATPLSLRPSPSFSGRRGACHVCSLRTLRLKGRRLGDRDRDGSERKRRVEMRGGGDGWIGDMRQARGRGPKRQGRVVVCAAGGGGQFSEAEEETKLESASGSGEGEGGSLATAGSAAALGGVLLLVGIGVVFREPLAYLLSTFSDIVDSLGPLGYLLFAAVYTSLEVLAVPAAPLTMASGVLFGLVPGTLVVISSATCAAVISFLIARYLARDRVAELVQTQKKWQAIDKAIGNDGFRVVVLLRLSPLLPFALSNYLYGLTSVPLDEYALGSFIGMLPGTFAYVFAGTAGKSIMDVGSNSGLEGLLSSSNFVTLAPVVAGVVFSVIGGMYIGRLTQKALKEVGATDES